jgi:hypothetical protein
MFQTQVHCTVFLKYCPFVLLAFIRYPLHATVKTNPSSLVRPKWAANSTLRILLKLSRFCPQKLVKMHFIRLGIASVYQVSLASIPNQCDTFWYTETKTNNNISTQQCLKHPIINIFHPNQIKSNIYDSFHIWHKLQRIDFVLNLQ